MEAASEMMAMSFLPSMNCCFSFRFTSLRLTCATERSFGVVDAASAQEIASQKIAHALTHKRQMQT